MEKVNVKRMDHHGLVMGVIRDLGLIDLINERVSTYEDEKLSVGERIAAMIINGLGFTDQPLSLVPEFFEELPLEELFGRPLDAKDFGRFSLARALDRVYDYDEEVLFAELAAEACRRSGIDTSCQSFDTTSFSLQGEYNQEGSEGCIQVTHGYSKDHRPDLKQVVTELLVTHDSGVPLVLKNWDGNASDAVIFERRSEQLVESFQRGYTEHVTADSKFYTASNSKHWRTIKFTTRVPETLKRTQEVLAAAVAKGAWKTHSSNDRLWYCSQSVYHYGIDQRWLVCRSEESQLRAKKTVEKATQKEREQIDKAIFHLQAKRFACAKDAEQAATALSKKWRYHQPSMPMIKEHSKYLTRGRPSEKSPKILEYQAILSYTENKTSIEAAIHRKACFVLATNQTVEKMGDEAVIESYKQQQSVERGYRFLKEPQFFTSSFFLKKPERISALIAVMTLSLLVYTIAQRRLRAAMLEKGATLPDQNKKPRSRITLKRAFQLLRGINVVHAVINGVQHRVIQGLNAVKNKVIELIGGLAMDIYQLRPQVASG